MIYYYRCPNCFKITTEFYGGNPPKTKSGLCFSGDIMDEVRVNLELVGQGNNPI